MSTLFRVHMAGGQHQDVTADKPEEARKAAKDKHPDAKITKIKVVKGE